MWLYKICHVRNVNHSIVIVTSSNVEVNYHTFTHGRQQGGANALLEFETYGVICCSPYEIP